MKQQKILIMLVVATLFIGVFAYAYINISKLQNTNVAPEKAGAKIVSCDVSIHNPIGIPLVRNGDLFIESANCAQQYVRNCGAVFGVFSDSGSLSISGSGGVGGSVDVNVGESSSGSASLSWCGSTLTSKVRITLRDDTGNILQARDVALS